MTTVLLVDDDAGMRSLMSRVFTREGYVPLEAADGSEAMAMLETILPDIILLDLEMPRLSGVEFLERIHQHPRLRQVPIVVLTGVSDTGLVNHVKQLGAKQFLLKAAFSIREMMQHVRELTPLPVH